MITRVPAVNISETEAHFHVELAAPGLKQKDFKMFRYVDEGEGGAVEEVGGGVAEVKSHGFM